MSIVMGIAVAGCLAWLVQAVRIILHTLRLPAIMRLDPEPPPVWPTVSALMPARDEQATIESALATRLADDYPALQIIALDDRSTDGTGRIIGAAAARDPRVIACPIETLPPDWLGKVHALQRGLEAADGEWLLISDADVHYRPGGLRRAVAWSEAEGIDFLALVPEYDSPSFGVNLAWAAFMRVLAMVVNPQAVRDPHRRAAIGCGAFMLVRRAVLEAAGGFESLRLETTDDIALGMLLKRAGARCAFANGRGLLKVRMYQDLGAMFRGIEKNAGALVHLPLLAVVGLLGLAGVVEISPWLALAGGTGWVPWFGGASAAAATLAAVTVVRANSGRVLPGLLWPLGWVLLTAGVLRATWLLHRRGGVQWRGTFYDRDQLRRGQRFRLF